MGAVSSCANEMACSACSAGGLLLAPNFSHRCALFSSAFSRPYFSWHASAGEPLCGVSQIAYEEAGSSLCKLDMQALIDLLSPGFPRGVDKSLIVLVSMVGLVW